MSRQILTLVLIILLAGACSNPYDEIQVDAKAPAQFKTSPLEGIYGNYQGVIAIGPRNAADTHSPSIVVISEPTVLLGGHWTTAQEVVDHIVHTHTRFNNADSDNQVQILEQSQRMLDGKRAQTLIFQREDMDHHDREPFTLVQHIIVTRHGSNIYTISYDCEQSVCDTYKPDFDAFVDNFRFRN